MSNSAPNLREAVEMNDEAQRKAIRDMDKLGIEDFNERQKVFADIQRQAKFWLQYLFWRHDFDGKDS